MADNQIEKNKILRGVFLLNKRLLLAASFVSGEGIAVDVGTDHAYLAEYLIKSEKCKMVYASDIGEKPLLAAANTIRKAGLSDKIKTFLSDGLENIPPEKVTDVIIAGMGGETIADIIKKCDWLKNNVNLILQPMTKADILREWLYGSGFEISEERAVKDDRFIYTVMKVRYSGRPHSITDTEKYIGKVSADYPDGLAYINSMAEKIYKIYCGRKSQKYLEIYEILKKIAGGSI